MQNTSHHNFHVLKANICLAVRSGIEFYGVHLFLHSISYHRMHTRTILSLLFLNSIPGYLSSTTRKINDVSSLVNQLEKVLGNEDGPASDLFAQLKNKVNDKSQLVLGYKMILKRERRKMMKMKRELNDLKNGPKSNETKKMLLGYKMILKRERHIRMQLKKELAESRSIFAGDKGKSSESKQKVPMKEKSAESRTIYRLQRQVYQLKKENLRLKRKQ